MKRPRSVPLSLTPCTFKNTKKKDTQLTYNRRRFALFKELPSFTRYREDYLSDVEFQTLQAFLLKQPDAGDLIEGTGGLRKLRHADPGRGKGKRSGLRVIYYWWQLGEQFWLFLVYDKDEMSDLSVSQKKFLKTRLMAELEARR